MGLVSEMGLAGFSPVEDSELPFSLLSWSKVCFEKAREAQGGRD